MRSQRLLALGQGIARRWLAGTEAATLPGAAACDATASTSGRQFTCSTLLRERFAMQRAGVHTSRLIAAAEEAAKSSARDPAPVSMRSLILMLMAGAGVTYATRQYTDQKLQQVVAKSQQVAGAAAIGGPFELTDQDGKPFTDKNLLGEFALFYFGFTHCPDICPDELEKIAEAIDQVDKWTGVQIVPVFISVDPQRDKPELIKSYIKEFHPRMVGLTGDIDTVKKVSKSYRVYYSKTGDSDTDYLVDHSIIHYLVSPHGEFVTFFGKNVDAEQMAKQLVQQLGDWQKEHPGYHKGKVLKAPESAATAAK